MKKYLYILLLFPMIIIGQTGNFIKSTSYKQASLATIANPTPAQVSQNITYFDGLGRPIQKIAAQQSASGKDIITHIKYDEFGRQVEEYLPFKSSNSNMAFDPNAEANVLSYYANPNPVINGNPSQEATTNPFSRKEFEVSPLNRILKQAAPGNDWKSGSGHEIKTDYQSNAESEVKLFNANTSWVTNQGLYSISLSNDGYYPINMLHKSVTYDENTAAVPSEGNGSTIEFKNKEGQIILKRTYGVVGEGTVNEKHDTYYVYDIYGNLTYVIPPKAVDLIGSTTTQQADLVSTAVVASGNTLNLRATNSITLSSEFNAQSGSTFTAVIDNSSQSVLDNLCYQYKYDYHNRLVEKKLPGKQWEFIVYDKLDRPILTQDANLKAQNKWLFTKYDTFSRVVYTGEYTKTSQNSRVDLQGIADLSTVLFENKQASNTINNAIIYYSNNAFPNTDINIFTINYYDDYNFDINGGVSENVGTITPSTATMSLATGNKIRILGTSNWITNVIYYDQKGRPIYNYSKNDFLGLIQKVKTELDFVGKATKITTKHVKGTTVDIIDTFTYDNQNRLLTQVQKINSQAEEIIVLNKYDELGQLIQKGVGGKLSVTNRLQTVDYAYNIRGWLKGINDTSTNNGTITMNSGDLFGFKINYTNPFTGTPLYNGNISETFWKTTNPTDTSLRNYSYSYDALNRLTQATDNSAINPRRYNEGIKYDKNGNIIRIVRAGNRDSGATTFGTMDNLFYTYDAGNKLIKVEDPLGSTEGFNNGSNTAIEYTYDDNGNMKTDANKGIIAIAYNHLNLPTDVTLAGGTIHYDNDAAGVKQRKVAGTITTDYAGGFQYEKIGTGVQTLKFFPTPEGYAENNNGTFSYVYQYKDHLGNVRLSYKDVGTTTPSLQIVEESNYYPFGMKRKVAGEVVSQTGYKYKYNGKELQDELGLNVYDYGSRNYDPVLGRWMNIDPKAELLEMSSPYVYALNCPIIYLDKDGELPILVNGQTNSDSERASASYWGTEIINTIKGSGIANPGGQFHFVDGDRGWNWYNGHSFASKDNPYFASDRRMGGTIQANDDWKIILSKLAKDPKTGKIIEKIQIYTHSRGSAFGEGYTESLFKLIKENANLFADADNEIDFVFDMAPHQSDNLTSVKGVSTYTIDHEGDPLADNDKSGVKAAFTTSESSSATFGAHKLGSFIKDIKEFTKAFLSGTTEKSVINSFVKNMKNNYGIKVTVEE